MNINVNKPTGEIPQKLCVESNKSAQLKESNLETDIEKLQSDVGNILISSNNNNINKSHEDLNINLKQDNKMQTTKIRCNCCNKKLSICTTITCKCEKTFCMEHRYPFSHNCTYDYKTIAKEELKRNNPLIIADKIKDRL